MGREIKCRGRRLDNSEWVYGYFCLSINGKTLIIPAVEYCNYRLWDGENPAEAFEVIPDTVGQFTGLCDKNGVDIFDGNAVDGSYINPMTGEAIKRIYSVVFENGCYIARLIGKSPYGDTQLYFVNEKCEVIGNIYDNPEFLEVER